MLMYPNLEQLSQMIVGIAQEQLLPRFATVKSQWKADGSLLTEADLAMQNQIEQALTPIGLSLRFSVRRWNKKPNTGY